MKKTIVYIGLFVLVIGCDVLDINPTNLIHEEAVKVDPVLVDAFLNQIYANTRFRSGSTYHADQVLLAVMSGEAGSFATWVEPWQAALKIIDENGAHEQAEYWPYDNIRSTNEIIKILKEATFDQDIVRQKVAEARWLRAFMYFELVKRYGGVPLITEPQSISQPIEELYVERNTEKEVYDFISYEMDDLVNILPENYSSSDFGRPTKWAAYALKSRAMLYAGSIAKYGSVQLNNILGIPDVEAGTYYQKAYDAAMQVINNSSHQLFKKYSDPVHNYNRLFIEDGNSEVIFAEVYDLSLMKTHSWNYISMPDGFQTGWGSNNWLYLESVEKYEYQDGTSGKLDWGQLDGNTKFDLKNLILKKDPRFLASCFYQEIPWQDGVVYSHSNTIGTISEDSDWPIMAPVRNRTKTGFLIRKRVDENIKLPIPSEDETDWIVFRTGEMYLNAAEAAFELDEVDEAKRLINIIRDRSEMPPKETLTVEEVRNERFVELYIEEHRYWDLRRWRIAVDELNGKGFHGVNWVYYIDEDKYTLQLVDADYNEIRTFAERNYYFPIGLKRLADNPNLVENPRY